MPIIKSSKKRVRQAAKRTARNAHLKKNIRSALQALEAKLGNGKKTDIANAQSKIDSLLDTAGKKNIFHKNKVARRKSQVAKMVRSAAITTKPTPTKTKTTKTTPTKSRPASKKN